MKTEYTAPLFQLISPAAQEFCAESVSSAVTEPGVFGGNADSLRDEDYE